MRRTLAPGALALLLAGCGAGVLPAPLTDTPEQAACRVGARQTPEALALFRQHNGDEPRNMERIRAGLAEIERRHMAACLRRQGLPLPGGVEPPRAAY